MGLRGEKKYYEEYTDRAQRVAYISQIVGVYQLIVCSHYESSIPY